MDKKGNTLPYIFFGGKKFFYNWDTSTRLLQIYDDKMAGIVSEKVSYFDQESCSLKEAVVSALVEAVDKKRQVEKLLGEALS